MQEKIEKYSTIITAILEEYATYRHTADEEVQVLIDPKNHYFQLQVLSWQNARFSHHIVFHFDIKSDGKIWIQANNTDQDVGTMLLQRGVERTDIVVGFQPPRYRELSGYAVA